MAAPDERTAERADGAYTLAPRRSSGKSGWVGRWAKRLVILAVGLVVALVVTHAILGWRAAAAWEAELAGYRARGEPILPADFVEPAVPDDQNAAVAVRALVGGINVESDAWKAFDAGVQSFDFRPTPDELALMAAVVRENGPLLAGLPAAVRRPGVDWGSPTRTRLAMNTDVSHLGRTRAAAQVLAAAAATAHAAGDDAAALRHVADLLALSRVVDRQPLLVPHLVALGIGAIADETAGGLAPSLRVADRGADGAPAADGAGPSGPRPASRAQAMALTAALLDDTDLARTRRRAMDGERMTVADAAVALGDGRLALGDLVGQADDRQLRSAKAAGYLFRPMAYNDAKLMARYLTAVRDAAAAPDYPSFQAASPGDRYEELIAPRQLHLMAAILMPAVNKAARQDYKAIAHRRMTAVALAARLYALDHGGDLPPTLGELVPRYLPNIPTDPLTAGKPLGYRPGGDRPLVYNVGENGRDDGGREITPDMSVRQFRETGDDVRLLRHVPRADAPAGDEVSRPAPAGPASRPTP